MKRLLVLLLLVPVGAGAQPFCPSNFSSVSESWSYYCDGGTKHLRLTITLETSIENDYDFSTATNLFCEIVAVGVDGGQTMLNVVSATTLTGSLHQLIAESTYAGPTTSLSFTRSGWITWHCSDYVDPELWFEESDGLFSVTDVSCSPLPVAQATWGAVKALYRSTGDVP